jgi:type I restriction enzyme M protein
MVVFANGSVYPLKAVASITAGISVTRLATDRDASPTPVISASDIEEDIRAREGLAVVHAASATVSKFCVQTSDVVVTTRGADVRAALVRDTHHGAIAGANLAIIRLDGSLLPILLTAFLRQPETRVTLLRPTAGASTPGFTIKALGELRICIPHRDQQRKLAELIDAAHAYRMAITEAVRLREAASNEIIARSLMPWVRSNA